MILKKYYAFLGWWLKNAKACLFSPMSSLLKDITINILLDYNFFNSFIHNCCSCLYLLLDLPTHFSFLFHLSLSSSNIYEGSAVKAPVDLSVFPNIF